MQLAKGISTSKAGPIPVKGAGYKAHICSGPKLSRSIPHKGRLAIDGSISHLLATAVKGVQRRSVAASAQVQKPLNRTVGSRGSWPCRCYGFCRDLKTALASVRLPGKPCATVSELLLRDTHACLVPLSSKMLLSILITYRPGCSTDRWGQRHLQSGGQEGMLGPSEVFTCRSWNPQNASALGTFSGIYTSTCSGV